MEGLWYEVKLSAGTFGLAFVGDGSAGLVLISVTIQRKENTASGTHGVPPCTQAGNAL